MAIKIDFDSSYNVISPTLVLATRNGEKLGGIIYHNLIAKDAIRNSMEMSFSVYKSDYSEANHNSNLWSAITDFKLVWVKEWNSFFEITVSIDEEETTIKEITAVSLGEAELSQINLYNTEINTENDIAREDYEPTVLYKPDNPNASLLHRITEKAPHYTIAHVDSSISNIQRTFTFDDKSICDAFQEIAEEIECVFEVECKGEDNHGIQRNIYVYDLKGYGKDTNILLTTDVLADNIHYSIDTGAVKNCFRLEGGDDLMTATIRNCNPNGSGYIWYISDELKSDMSDELVERLQSYNGFYDYYQNTYDPFAPSTTGLSETDAQKISSKITSNATLRTKYNDLVDKYSTYSTDYQKIESPLVGYPSIMEAYYNTVDFYYYLNNSLMPTVAMSDTTAKKEAEKLTFQSLKNTAVQNLSGTTSVATVSSAILAMAKAIIDIRYQTKIVDETATFTYSATGSSTWKGDIKVTNYSDEEDTYTISLRGITISSDYSNFIQQKLKVALANTREDTIASIDKLFELDDSQFKGELKKYSLQRLKAFHDACQGCIDVLIQQGVADNNNTESTLYKKIYLPYYNKLGYIQSEMDVRQDEIYVVTGKYDSDGGLVEEGMQVLLERERDAIQSNLDFQKYLGDSLWKEFVAYRREDTYSNTNYVSDGLGNNELFTRAMEFIETAKEEIEKSATKQHTIDATLRNLLVMKEFAPIVKNFTVGNWLRIKVDGKLFKLRLVDYQIDFENLENIDITFSDIALDNGNEVKSVLNQASSMATSYNSVSRQARRADKNSAMVENWVDDGLSLTTTKIVDKADNQEVSWDKHGLICREYDALTDSYSDKQVKLINKGVYITDNGWRTAKAGIGNFTFFNPAANNGDGEYQEAYGVIADTIVGNVILGKNVGIYNTKNSITMDENGFTLTTDGTGSDDPQSVFTIRRKTVNNGVKSFKDMFYIDSNGFVTINGGVKIDIDGQSGNSTMVEMVDGKITTHITDELADGGLIESSISQTAESITSTVSATYETKTDSNSKKTALESSIRQTASNIASTVKATSGWDISSLGYTINLIGTIDRGNDHSAIGDYIAGEHIGEFYLNDLTGHVYESKLESGSTTNYAWWWKANLTRADSSIYSRIDQTANSITSTVSSAVSKYDTSGYTITLYGYGAPTTSPNSFAASSYNGKYYLDQNNGKLYLSNGSSWRNVKTLSLITDNLSSQITQTAGEIRSEVSSTYETKTDATTKKTNLESSISQTAAQIRSTVSSAVSKYDTTGYTITISGYGAPTTSPNSFAASSYNGKYYLDQNNGKLYLSNGSSWSNVKTLKLITTNLQTQITQNATDITSKVSSGDFGTMIQQNVNSVKIAWNNISKYISFANAALNIYDNGTTQNDSTLLMRLNSSGLNLYESDGSSGNRLTMRLNRSGAFYYNEGKSTGKIGTNKIAGDSTARGLVFNLDTKESGEGARYMGWSYMENSTDESYTLKMVYYANDFQYTHTSGNVTTYNKGFHFADDVYFRQPVYLLNGASIQSNTYSGISLQCDNMVQIKGNGGQVTLNNSCVFLQPSSGGYIGASGDLHMNNHTIYDTNVTSSSDARLKTNISSSQIKGLSTLNNIEVSSFDWIATDEHVEAGLIAQQLQEIIPEAVLENPDTNRLSIKNDALIPYIIKAIQELTSCIGNDNKYKVALQSLGISTSKGKNKWLDRANMEQKSKFIIESRPTIPDNVSIDKNKRKVFLPG